MSVVALAPERVQQLVAARNRPSLNYTRGCCPNCNVPMIVHLEMPDAPCVACHEAEEAPKKL